jgi:2-methylcitrate dehydratase PrpD
MVKARDLELYTDAFLDWLACATRGLGHPAVRATLATGDRVLSLGAAGHVLDYDDTYAPGLAHLSAACAPAALAVGAERGASLTDVLEAYADGFEAMGALARASHPALYDRGWHPTAVCGVVGAAVAAARLLSAERDQAVAIALLRTGGLQAAFGSEGKALQVGLAASTGVAAARLTAAGARVSAGDVISGAAGFEAVYGARYAEPSDGVTAAVQSNWIKAWPCCLQTHSAIEAADRAREGGLELVDGVQVTVHPISLRAAAHGPSPAGGLAAKFSIPYLVGYTLMRGPPRVASFDRVEEDVALAAGRYVIVKTDDQLGESEAVLAADGREYRVIGAMGSPERPLNRAQLEAKVRDLAGTRLDHVLDDLAQPAGELLDALGV